MIQHFESLSYKKLLEFFKTINYNVLNNYQISWEKSCLKPFFPTCINDVFFTLLIFDYGKVNSIWSSIGSNSSFYSIGSSESKSFYAL